MGIEQAETGTKPAHFCLIISIREREKFVEDENIVPKDYKFNVRDVETLRDKDNCEASLFRTIIQFQ